MTLHLTIWWLWWLWWLLIAVYAVGVFLGTTLTRTADDLTWWLRPVILIWPAVLLGLILCRLACFMTGKD